MTCEKSCKNTKKQEEECLYKPSKICEQCKEVESSFFTKSRAFCGSCFSIYLSRKFHKTIDSFLKNDSFPKNNKLLVAISDGTSLSLLKFLLQESHSFTFKTYFNTMSFIHIDEEGLTTEVSRTNYIHQKVNEMFPEYKKLNKILVSRIYEKSIHSINDFLLPLLSPTSRIDILKRLRNNIIYDFSEKNGYNVIIWGDTATSLASKIISETAKGRGYSIPWETRGKIKNNYNIWSLRPMKDIIKREAHFFLQINGFESELKSFDHKITTIDQLVDQYFDTLEKSNPNFAFTVVRTATKLQIPKIENMKEQSSNFCFLCQMPKENNAKEWIEKIILNKISAKEGSNINTDNNYNNYDDKTEDICYGCFTIIRESKNEIILPYIEKKKNIHIRNPKDEVLCEYLIKE
ncbi:hypothetical protein PCANB_002004 [Pneumocystis canis]|nr:hypothetical protein PCANB_002004 [Pneumocystis canis]